MSIAKTKMEWEIINEIGFINSYCRKLYQICMDAMVQIEFICSGSKNQQKKEQSRKIPSLAGWKWVEGSKCDTMMGEWAESIKENRRDNINK